MTREEISTFRTGNGFYEFVYQSAQARELACSLRQRIQDQTFMGDGYKTEEESLEP